MNIYQPYSILIILVVTMGLFISGLWRYDIIALLALALSVAVGAVPYTHVFNGLANPAVITVACVMIISQTIHHANLLAPVSQQLLKLNQSPSLQVSVLCLITAFLSAFMNNVGALALMMPIAIQATIKSKRSPSLVLLPIALASALGGLLTMIGTPSNLIIANFRAEAIGQPFEMFDFFRVGIFVMIIGVIFIAVIGWRLIPGSRKSPASIEERFAISDYITEIKLPEQSTLIGKTLKEMEEYLKIDYILIELIRKKQRRSFLPASTKLEKNDILIVEIEPQNLQIFIQKAKCDVMGSASKGVELLKSEEMTTVEVTIPPGSRAINRSAKQMRLKAYYDSNLLGISRQGKTFKERIHDVLLKAGDVILLYGPVDSIRQQINDYGLLPLEKRDILLSAKGKRWLPVIIFGCALILAAIQLLPVSIAFSGAVLALILSGSIQTRNLYKAIDWPVIILLAAMIPVGEALRTTGGTELIADFIASSAVFLSPIFILALLFIITMTLSDFMNNAATTVVMAPIAIGIAQALHANIDPFLMAVAIAASCSFLTPVGHQNNTIVMGPGGYRFTDYIRIGLPLELLVLVTAIPAIFWLWPIDY